MSEETLPANRVGFPSPQHITLANELPAWADVVPTFEVIEHQFPYNHYLNEMVAVHSGPINTLDCDVLVMPISSCYKGADPSGKNRE